MPKDPLSFDFSYATLARITGQDEQTIRKHRSRGFFDPLRLETVVVYLARFGVPELKKRLVDFALQRDANSAEDELRKPIRLQKPKQ